VFGGKRTKGNRTVRR